MQNAEVHWGHGPLPLRATNWEHWAEWH